MGKLEFIKRQKEIDIALKLRILNRQRNFYSVNKKKPPSGEKDNAS
tara:strand:- start:3185 stop:3322 length:138 start_codon:yes stop_codon:yes gene_type:complete